MDRRRKFALGMLLTMLIAGFASAKAELPSTELGQVTVRAWIVARQLARLR